MSDELPPEILAMVEGAVDKDLRCYRPPLELVLRRVRRQCRREGWALNDWEEHKLVIVIRGYIDALRRRTRQPRLIGDGRS